MEPFEPFRHRYPGLEVHLLEAAATRQNHVDRGDVQLGILPSVLDALHGEPIHPMLVMVAVARNIRSPDGSRSKSRFFADKPLLLLSRQFGLRSWFEATCDVAHIKPRMLLESSALHTLTALREGYGIAVVPSDVPIAAFNICRALVHRGAPVGR